MEKMRLYILTKNGAILNSELIKMLVNQTKKYGELEDLGFGSAYNDPVYLLEKIETHIDSTFVVAWDMDDNLPHPRALVGRNEITPFMEALEMARDEDSWKIAIRINKEIRKKE